MSRPIEKLDIAMAMKRYGGSFMQGIGEALLHADHTNATKLAIAFSREWMEYAEIAKREIEKENIVNDNDDLLEEPYDRNSGTRI